MYRVSTFTMIAAILAAGLTGFFQSNSCSAQDITITVKKGDDQPDQKKPFQGDRPSVDVAILLDTSNSMDGLIQQAKTQLWKIVQQFADAKKAGQTPVLRVAVFEYGNSRLPASEGYIRQVVQLTDDLDKVSQALFELKTSGGDEYCGMVIGEALKRLDWSSDTKAYKAIFIAGNEPFTQGDVAYQDTCRKAIQSGIVINTIHCGDYSAGINGEWKQGAVMGEGEYMNINQDRAVVHIDAPQDKIIIELNTQLNKTYLWYGSASTRKGYQQNQILQDENSIQASGGGFGGGRAKTKASAIYGNNGRDLVDTAEQDKSILSRLKPESLPDEMQKMSAEERVQHLKKMASKRAEIKGKLLEVIKQRDAYVASKQIEKATGEKDTLGDAVSEAIQKQLKASGFEKK